MIDPLVANALEVFHPEAHALEGLVQLSGSRASGPPRLERGDCPRDLAAVHPIAAFVRTRVSGELDSGPRHGFEHNLRELPDPVVLVRASHVERLTMYPFAGGLQHGDEGAGDVLDVDDGAPGRPVALQVDPARGIGPRHEVIQHKIETEAG